MANLLMQINITTPLGQHKGGSDSTSQHLVSMETDAAILNAIASMGVIGNTVVIAATLCLSKLRCASNALLVHHCVLDLIKSLYCLPSMQTTHRPHYEVFCSLLGNTYMLFLTMSAFNLLALIMSEAYRLADLILGIKDSRNCCCVAFSVIMIWFGSAVMNLGFAFIPITEALSHYGNDHCLFIYGITQHYILQMLWIILVTMAIAMAMSYMHKVHTDIKRLSYYRFMTLVRATVIIDPKVRTRSQCHRNEGQERQRIKSIQRTATKKLCVLALLTCIFVTFWYPMFVFLALNPLLRSPTLTVRILTLLAWSNPAVTPFVMMLYIIMACNTPDEKHLKVTSEAAPETSGHQHRSFTDGVHSLIEHSV